MTNKIKQDMNDQYQQNETANQIKCMQCGHISLSERKQDEHINKKHVMDVRCYCPVCKTRFIDNSQFTAHVNRVNNANSNNYCTVCNTKFPSNSRFKAHINRVKSVNRKSDRRTDHSTARAGHGEAGDSSWQPAQQPSARAQHQAGQYKDRGNYENQGQIYSVPTYSRFSIFQENL